MRIIQESGVAGLEKERKKEREKWDCISLAWDKGEVSPGNQVVKVQYNM